MKNACETIDALMRKQPAERMGLFDSPWEDTLEKWADRENYPRQESGKPMAAVDYFGFDMVSCGGWFDTMPLRGVHEVLRETQEWTVYRNGAGAVFKTWKHKSGTPEHIEFSMASREIWEKDYRPHLLDIDRGRIDVAGARKELQRRKKEGLWTFYGHLFIWEQLRCSLGDICMYESLALDPAWIHDFNRVYTDFFKTYYTMLIEEAGRPDGIWLYDDLGYNKGLICSPTMLADLFCPYYHELVEFFHGYDLPVVLHSCGGITEALPLIVECGFDGLNPMEVKAGCDVVRFAQEYGDKLTFIGGLDARVLESGDRDLIRREIIRILDGMRSLGARYIFGSDHSLSTIVRLADFRYAIEVFKEHGAY